MKRLIKYLTLISLAVVTCLFMTAPAMAQRGGHSGGGGGGGHVSGGGFSGGGHFSGGVSAGRSAGMSRGSAVRPGVAPRSGYTGQRTAGYRGGVRAGVGSRGAIGSRGVRPYIRGNNGAGVYGHGGGYGHYGWGRHGGWFYNHGYFGGLYYPWIGFGFGYLPYGCYPFYWGDEQYYYGDGFFYQYDDDQYTVVDPPVGAEVKSLPKDAKSIMINGEQYYEEKGVYYMPVKKDDGTIVYQVAGKDGELDTGETGVASVTPQVGDIVTKLPPDCRKVNLNGGTYYVSEDGIYYQPTVDGNGNKVYKIVALDSDNAGN